VGTQVQHTHSLHPDNHHLRTLNLKNQAAQHHLLCSLLVVLD